MSGCTSSAGLMLGSGCLVSLAGTDVISCLALQVRVQQALAAAGGMAEQPSAPQAPELQASSAAAPVADEWEGVSLMSPDQLQQAGIHLHEDPAPALHRLSAATDEWEGAQLMSGSQLQDAGISMTEHARQPGFQPAGADPAGLPPLAGLLPLAGLTAAAAQPSQMQPRRLSALQVLQTLPDPRHTDLASRQASGAGQPATDVDRPATDDGRPAESQAPLEMLQQAQKLALQAQQLHLSSQAAVHRLRKTNYAAARAAPQVPQLPQAPVPPAFPGTASSSKGPYATFQQHKPFNRLPLPEVPPASAESQAKPTHQPHRAWGRPRSPEPADSSGDAGAAPAVHADAPATMQALSPQPSKPQPPAAPTKPFHAPLPSPPQPQQPKQQPAPGPAPEHASQPLASLQASPPTTPITRHVWSEADARLAADISTGPVPGHPTPQRAGLESHDASKPYSSDPSPHVDPPEPVPSAQSASQSRGLQEQPERSLAGNAPPWQVRQGSPAICHRCSPPARQAAPHSCLGSRDHAAARVTP